MTDRNQYRECATMRDVAGLKPLNSGLGLANFVKNLRQSKVAIGRRIIISLAASLVGIKQERCVIGNMPRKLCFA